MSELQELIPMTLDEFETMIKDERLCYELIDGIVAPTAILRTNCFVPSRQKK